MSKSPVREGVEAALDTLAIFLFSLAIIATPAVVAGLILMAAR